MTELDDSPRVSSGILISTLPRNCQQPADLCDFAASYTTLCHDTSRVCIHRRCGRASVSITLLDIRLLKSHDYPHKYGPTTLHRVTEAFYAYCRA